MNPRYIAWLDALAKRDQTLVTLAGLALALVSAWCLVEIIPAKIRPWVYRAYLVGGLVLYVVILIRSFFS